VVILDEQLKTATSVVQGWGEKLDETESWQSIADLVLKVCCVAVCCRGLQRVAVG